MKRFRLNLAYDGTPYEGWQNQGADARTVQGELEQALSQLLHHPTNLVGAGRTDSGVHARSQTAHFEAASTRMDGLAFQRGLNSLLPRSIRVLSCQEVSENFHARFSALARVYHYYLQPNEVILPWDRSWVTPATKIPPLVRLNAMAHHLHGEQDFTTFSHAQDPSKSRSRFIYQASWFAWRDRIVFRIAGNAFLWRMVRSLVGTMLAFGCNPDAETLFADAFASRDRLKAGPTAPAEGLFLHKVVYHAHEFSL